MNITSAEHSNRSLKLGFLMVFWCLGVLAVASAATVPVKLPRPDKTPPATDKPVQVYILSGQSNMVGFGRVKGASPVYPSIFLSADPSVMPCRMPVG